MSFLQNGFILLLFTLLLTSCGENLPLQTTEFAIQESATKSRTFQRNIEIEEARILSCTPYSLSMEMCSNYTSNYSFYTYASRNGNTVFLGMATWKEPNRFGLIYDPSLLIEGEEYLIIAFLNSQDPSAICVDECLDAECDNRYRTTVEDCNFDPGPGPGPGDPIDWEG